MLLSWCCHRTILVSVILVWLLPVVEIGVSRADQPQLALATTEDVSELKRMLNEKDSELLSMRQQLEQQRTITGTTASLQPQVASSFQENDEWYWLDELSVFAGLDGSKQMQDFGINAQMGGRVHANWALPLFEEWGIGLQLGTGLNYSDNAVKVIDRIGGPGERTQSFTTLGVFQRLDNGWIWGAAYDYLYMDYFSHANLSQFRGRVGYELTECDEIGTWFTLPIEKDEESFLGIPVRLDPVSQANLYWRRTWENTAQTSFWLGIGEGHGQANVALGDLPSTHERLVFGADINVPLNDYVALFGEANFLTPANTDTVDAYLGFAIYPGGRAKGNATRRFSPALPVANNNSMIIDLRRE